MWMERFGDPPIPGFPDGFAYHEAMAKLWGVIAIRLADIDILPFDHMAYANRITSEFVSCAPSLALMTTHSESSLTSVPC